MRPVVKRIMEGASADKFKKIAYCLAIFIGMYAVNTSGPSYSVSRCAIKGLRIPVVVPRTLVADRAHAPLYLTGPTHSCC